MISSGASLTLENVLYARKDGIAYVTLNRPKVLNALNTPTWTDLRSAFEAARDDGTVHGVILTGSGDKAFIAGADVSELAHVAGFEAQQSSRFGQGVLDLIENLGKPVIAAINGFALGGGCEAAMACTFARLRPRCRVRRDHVAGSCDLIQHRKCPARRLRPVERLRAGEPTLPHLRAGLG
jgi:enoyl-CoA hydratase